MNEIMHAFINHMLNMIDELANRKKIDHETYTIIETYLKTFRDKL